MQAVVCFANTKHSIDVNEKQRYELGVPLGQ